MMSALRLGAEAKLTRPNQEFHLSDTVLASMELGVKSINWEMMKEDLSKHQSYNDLASWITGGCKGPVEELHQHIKPYWKLRNQLHCIEYIPMFNDRTIIPTGMGQQV